MSERVWIPHQPEQRLSIVVNRFLNAALVQPFYCTAIHDADEGTRTDRQRARDKDRGQMPGQLDWDVVQGLPSALHGTRPLARKLELKRNKNVLSDNQRVTFRKLRSCGAMPVLAWTLREVYEGLAQVGFVFSGNVETLLQKYEAELEALDRTADLATAGTPAKRKSSPRKAEPRFLANKRMTKTLNAG